MSTRKNQREPKKESSLWQKTQYANLIRYTPSGTYFARIRVSGKLVWKSLKTDGVTIAKLRLADLEKAERAKAESGRELVKGRLTFGEALEAYRQRGFRPTIPRNRKDARPLKPAAIAYYEQRTVALRKSWPGLAEMEVRRITDRECSEWADKVRRKWSATSFNHTLGLVRHVFEHAIHVGARYDNPAMRIMRESEQPKHLELPDGGNFEAFVRAIETSGSGWSKHCADLVRFMAFGGFRKGEAQFVTWANCDFVRGTITLRGHPETGLKNRMAGEFRVVPMIPEMRALLERIRNERSSAQPTDRVMLVAECQKAMNRAAAEIGIPRLTHHDLRHLFATRCIESGVDIPTVARWLGHKDGGALAMRVYGHLRDQHSAAMAQKVTFAP